MSLFEQFQPENYIGILAGMRPYVFIICPGSGDRNGDAKTVLETVPRRLKALLTGPVKRTSTFLVLEPGGFPPQDGLSQIKSYASGRNWHLRAGRPLNGDNFPLV